MKNVVGNAAEKENFYPRNKEIEKIKRALDAGSHIQIAAPRRVGKTSILFYLKNNPFENYTFVYVITESIFTENLFYKILYQEILRSDAISKTKSIVDQIKGKGNKFLRKIKSLKALGVELEFDETNDDTINYYEELINFIKGIDLEGKKIVMMIDEFPQTVENIIEENKGDTKKTKEFLRTNRALRQDIDFSNKVQFIYTGSIGLNSTVAKLDASAAIGDIKSIQVDPLERNDAKKLVQLVLTTYNYKIGDNECEYLLNKIEWFIPYHLQLAICEIMDTITCDEMISKQVIDKVFTNIIEFKNYNSFNLYYERLHKIFKANELKLVREILHKCANNKSISKNEIYDLSVKYTLENIIKYIVETLVYDGYINNYQNANEYKFNSPLLKLFWQRYEFS